MCINTLQTSYSKDQQQYTVLYTETTINLIFFLHHLGRLGHNQGEHVKHKVKITEILQYKW
jgi:hypothetical protein